MQALVDILEKLESFIYKILIWLILIPKTLLKIVLDPTWAPDYIKNELDPKKGASRFDEYFSPIVLLLVVALVPYVVWSFIPTTGVKISSPVEDTSSIGTATDTSSAERALNFDAEIRFISTASTGYITTFWQVEKEDFIVGNYFYPVQSLKRHTNNPAEFDACSQAPSVKLTSQLRKNSLGIANCLAFRPPILTDHVDYTQIDGHTVQDSFNYEFRLPGSYYVVLNVSKFDKQGKQIETYIDEIFVDVPKSPQDNVSVYTKSKPSEVEFSFKNVTNQFENEKTIFLALGLLIPPLLFALVLKLLDGEELSEDSIKEIFHVQCYYFSPLALTFWTYQYAGRFVTPDVFNWYDTRFKLIILLPLLLVVFWFISVQTDEISKQKMKINGQQKDINGLLAFLIVMGCVVVLVPGVLLILYGSAPAVQEGVRKFSIWLYPLLAVGLLTYYILSATRRKDEKPPVISANEDSAEQPASSIEKALKEQFNYSMDKVLAVQPAIPVGRVLARGTILIILVTMGLVWKLGNLHQFNSQSFDSTQQSFATVHSAKSIGTIEIQTLTAIPLSTLFPASATEASDGSPQNTSTPPSQTATPSSSPTSPPSSTPSPPPPTSTVGFAGGSNSQAIPTNISSSTNTPLPTATPFVIVSPTALPNTGGGGGAPIPEQRLYGDEFTGNLDAAWTSFVTQGDANAVSFNVGNEKFSVNIVQSNDMSPWFYLLNTDFTDADVQIETTAVNRSVDANGVGLICRATSAGWYEFNVSNSGLYAIYAYDGTYNVLESGKIDEIIYSDSNMYIAICNENDLELWVNDSLVATTQDDRFTDGFFGLSVSSPKGLPVSVDFEYLNVGQPW